MGENTSTVTLAPKVRGLDSGIVPRGIQRRRQGPALLERGYIKTGWTLWRIQYTSAGSKEHLANGYQ